MSGISGGAITITNGAGQQAKTGQTAAEAVAGVNRDVTSDSGSNGLTKTWNGQQLFNTPGGTLQALAPGQSVSSVGKIDYATATQSNGQAQELVSGWVRNASDVITPDYSFEDLIVGGMAGKVVTDAAMYTGGKLMSFIESKILSGTIDDLVVTGSDVTNTGVSSVWGLNPLTRGAAIEKELGQNLPQNFPVIDIFNQETGAVTSIKSLNINAASYQNGSTLSSKLNGYIDNVAGYRGTGPNGWAGITIDASQITGRTLDLAIPNAGSAGQQQIIDQAVQYGLSKGVRVNVIIHP